MRYSDGSEYTYYIINMPFNRKSNSNPMPTQYTFTSEQLDDPNFKPDINMPKNKGK